MSDDLVKRLRDLGDRAGYMPHMHHVAADRIEELEAELLETQDRANAFATKEYHTEMRAKQAEAKLKKARNEALEEVAARVAPIGERPCDCDGCYCGNPGDNERVTAWDQANSISVDIRAMIEDDDT